MDFMHILDACYTFPSELDYKHLKMITEHNWEDQLYEKCTI